MGFHDTAPTPLQPGGNGHLPAAATNVASSTTGFVLCYTIVELFLTIACCCIWSQRACHAYHSQKHLPS